MNISLNTFLTGFLLFCLNLGAQFAPFVPSASMYGVVNNQIGLIRGDVQKLSSAGAIRVKYDYSNLRVNDTIPEVDYLDGKKADLSEKKGKHFVERWFDMRANYLQPRFEEYFNKYCGRMGINISHSPDSKGLTLLVEVVDIRPEPYGAWGYPPYVTMKCTFLDADENELAYIKLTAFGSRKWSLEPRMTECFAIAGKMLGKKILKELK